MIVAIRVDASSQIGSGHVMRCLSLAAKLQKEHDAQVCFIMRQLAGNLFSLVKDKGYSVLSLPAEQTEQKLAGYEKWLTVPLELDAKETIDKLEAIGPVDLLVVDSYAIDVTWENTVRPYVKKIMVIDDLANRRHNCDLLLDQNLYEDMHTRYNHLVPSHCQLYLGPKYALLRDEFYKARKTIRQRNGTIQNIVVFYGGVDATNETMKALRALEKIRNADSVTVNVIVGANNLCKDEIEKCCMRHSNWHYYCQVSNMAMFMNEADLMLGAGGSTTWERCFLRLPALVTAVAENQIESCKYLEKCGIIEYLGVFNELEEKQIVHAIDAFDQCTFNRFINAVNEIYQGDKNEIDFR
jgi:UDP-2,4-diacetamido-2,4,6-trideoxy-beta-L-altropyranose hydrolase